MIVSLVVGFVAGAAMFLASGFHASPYNNYVVLADALRHGHVWIDWPGVRVDALARNGRYYIIEGPLPAILILPFVATRWPLVTSSPEPSKSERRPPADRTMAAPAARSQDFSLRSQ